MNKLRIRDLREDADMNQTEIAEILNTTQRVYSRYETEERTLPLQHLIKLAQFYGVSTDYILGLTDIKDPLPRHEQKNVFTTARTSGDTSANKTSSL